MKLNAFKRFTVPEIILLIVFIVYILFPIATPHWLKPMVNSSLGIMVMFALCISLFIYTNPSLGIVSVFVAYEMMRRSAVGINYMNTPSVDMAGEVSARAEQPPQHQPTSHADIIRAPLNIVPEPAEEPPHRFAYQTLEEEVILRRAPIGVSEPLQMTSSSFQPITSDLKNASLV